MTRDELAQEIARRAPWYQKISFPSQGITTTDDPNWAMLDAAPDNRIGDISREQAALTRPIPKWNAIKFSFPSLKGKEILEIGSNCGFFSFEFVRAGASRVVGLDVAKHWLENATWAADILGFRNVEFYLVDFMAYDGGQNPRDIGLVGDFITSIPLPDKQFDIVFSSTVIDHLFFPFFSIYKMIRLSREMVILDCPCDSTKGPFDREFLTLSTNGPTKPHGFYASSGLWSEYVARLGIPEDSIERIVYNDGRSHCLLIDTRNRHSSLRGA